MSQKNSDYNIPKISDEKIKELSHIKALVRNKLGLLYYVEDHNVKTKAFTWLEPHKKAMGLKKVGSIKTLHRFAFQGFFKPSLEEVYAQLPTEFENIDAVETILQDGFNMPALNAGFHVAETILYKKKVLGVF